MEIRILCKILYRRRVIFCLILSTFLILVGLVTLLVPKSYEGTAKVIVEKNDKNNAVMKGLGVAGLVMDTRVDEEVSFDTDLELLMLRPLVDRLIVEMDLRDSSNQYLEAEDFLDGGIKSKLKGESSATVKQYNFTALIRIIASSTSPEQAAAIANRLAEMYIDDRLSRTRADFTEVRKKIGKSLVRIEQEYLQKLKEYRKFKERTGVVSMDTAISNLLGQIVTLENNQTETQLALAVLRETIDASQAQLEKTSRIWESGREVEQNSIALVLRTNLTDLSAQLAGLGVSLTEQNPDYKKMTARIDVLTAMLKNEPEFSTGKKQFTLNPVYSRLCQALSTGLVEVKSMLVKIDTNEQQLQKYRNKLLALPAIEMDDSKLSSDLSVSSSLYADILEYDRQISLAEMIAVSKVRLVEPAKVPDNASFPRKKVNMILALLFGGFFAAAAALMVEYADNSLREEEQLRSLTDKPFLGSLSCNTSLKMRPALLSHSSARINEQLRSIRDTLIFETGGEKEGGLYMVTSVGAQGGASILASGLARMFAERYGNTLLLDLNLRSPSLVRLLKKPGKINGVREALSEDGKLREDSVQETTVQGLFLLPAGMVQGDPSNLLDSQALPALLNTLRQQFRYVIIDTPSPTFYHDAMVIAGQSAAVLLIARGSRITADQVRHSLHKLRIAGDCALGTVLNCEGHSLSLHRLPWLALTFVPAMLRNRRQRSQRS